MTMPERASAAACGAGLFSGSCVISVLGWTLWTFACTDAIVPDGWHTIVAALIVQASSCCPAGVCTTNLIAGCLLFCLQGVADDPLPAMAIAM
jgi:hypothetical protein